jgi:hypothetical protein
MAGPARTAEWRVGVALTPRDRRLISWLQVNYGYIDPIEVRNVNDGLLRLVLNIPAPNAAEAMQWVWGAKIRSAAVTQPNARTRE